MGEEEKEKSKLWVRSASGLVRTLGPFDSLMFAFVSYSLMNAFVFFMWTHGLYPGANWVTASIIGVSLFVPIGLVYAMLSSSMPRTGAEYLYASRIVSPFWGFFAGWAMLATIITSFGTSLASFAAAYGIGAMIHFFAIQTSNVGLNNFGLLFTGGADSASVDTSLLMLVTVVIAFVFAFRMRVVKWVVWICGVWQWIAVFTFVYLAETTSLTTIKANMLTLSGINYNQLITTATGVGYAPGLSSASATLIAAVSYVGLTVMGFNYIANVAGEVKQVQKSQIIGLIGSLFMGMIAMVLFGAVAYMRLSPNFVNAMGYLIVNGKDVSFFQVPLALTVMANYMTRNPILAMIPASGLLAGCMGIMTTFAAVATRYIFAFSFDGILPSWFSKVDRHGTPYIATIAMFVPAAATVFIYMFTPIWNFCIFTILFYFVAYAIAGAAGLLFMWRKKAIFNASPKFTNAKIGSLPIIAIIGFFVLAFAIASLVVIVVGTPLSVIVSNAGSIVVIMGMGVVIYFAARVYNRRRHIPLQKRFEEIPPD